METGYDLDLDYKAPEVVRDTNPHTVKVAAVPEVRQAETKDGTKSVVDVLLKIVDTELENPKLVKYSIWLPDANDTKEQQNTGKGRIVKFQAATGLDAKSVGEFVSRLGETVGKEFQVVLKVKHDDTYGDSNEVKRIMV